MSVKRYTGREVRKSIHSLTEVVLASDYDALQAQLTEAQARIAHLEHMAKMVTPDQAELDTLRQDREFYLQFRAQLTAAQAALDLARQSEREAWRYKDELEASRDAAVKDLLHYGFHDEDCWFLQGIYECTCGFEQKRSAIEQVE